MDAVVILILTFSLIIVGALLLLFVCGIVMRKVKDPLIVLRAEIDKKNDEKEQHYAKYVLPVLEKAHYSLCKELEKPNSPLMLDVFAFKDEIELQQTQIKLPDQWSNWPNTCYCWTNNGVFYILETLESVEKRAKICPDHYKTLESAKSQIRNLLIPIDSIHYYKVKGDVVRSERTLIPPDISYSGISVNGIGFGEVKTTPALDRKSVV